MFLRNLRFFLSETRSNFIRNRHATAITVIQTLISLFVLGIFLIIIINTNRLVTGFLNNLQVAVFLDYDLDTDQTSELYHSIRDLPGITKIDYVSKADAQEWMEGEVPFNFEDMIDHNPLPASFRLSIASARYAPLIAGKLEGVEGIQEIKYAEETLGNYLPIFYFILGSCFVLAVVIAGATIFTISNTIRLAIYARRKEIKIMQLVGATDWAIRGPFLLEGFVYGLIGSILSFALVSIGYSLLFNTFNKMVIFRPIFVGGWQMAYNLFILMVVLGTIIGVAGSLIAVDRYLEAGYAEAESANSSKA